jgi:hypothetical protein
MRIVESNVSFGIIEDCEARLRVCDAELKVLQSGEDPEMHLAQIRRLLADMLALTNIRAEQMRRLGIRDITWEEAEGDDGGAEA